MSPPASPAPPPYSYLNHDEGQHSQSCSQVKGSMKKTSPSIADTDGAEKKIDATPIPLNSNNAGIQDGFTSNGVNKFETKSLSQTLSMSAKTCVSPEGRNGRVLPYIKSRTKSFDESLVVDYPHRRDGSYTSSSQYHSSHHSSAPLSNRYEYGSTGTRTQRSPFALGPERLVKLRSEGSDEEKQSLFQQCDANAHEHPNNVPVTKESSTRNGGNKTNSGDWIYNLIYALLNTTMSVPSLYGYASVIFNNQAFQPHIATLSKLVIWSSAVHQLTFVAFSSLSFAKAEVQDAGLLFLSCMSNYIAETISNEGGGIEEILSTTIVTLGIATATLGLVLMFLGKFNCADAVSYLPLPVVGGYLAFIGYFCVIAGVGLCISTSMIDGGFLSDLRLLFDRQTFLLAFPGLIAGLLMMLISRFVENDAALPITMVGIPCSFYLVLYCLGYSLDDARNGKWVGEVQPAASFTSLLELVDLSSVRWDLVFSTKCFSVWIGMVFVVSFSSCLDVAAISMDMGEALDVNKELITVGLSNLLSGLSFGQSGSYIFSQTIFQYRTGYLSRWVGFLGVLMFLSVVLSNINLLEIAPLFFLGSTLIFIGIDLLYEWLFEVYHKLIPSEYFVLVATFIAIQVVGIDVGIIIGFVVAGGEYVLSTARVSSLRRVLKQSRNIWQPRHKKLLQKVGYDSRNPKIVTLEIRDTVFFGSSLLLLSKICDEIGISASATDMVEMSFASPRHLGRSPGTPTAKSLLSTLKKNRELSQAPQTRATDKRTRPRYVVLDLSQVPNVDATAARSCFLQLAKMCSKQGVVLCAAGANARVDWILKSHDVAYSEEEANAVKRGLLYPHRAIDSAAIPMGRLLLFDSLSVALQLCENKLIYDLEQKTRSSQHHPLSVDIIPPSGTGTIVKTTLSTIFGRMLGMDNHEGKQKLSGFDDAVHVENATYYYGDDIYKKDDDVDSFYIVLAGSVEIYRNGNDELEAKSSLLNSSRRSFHDLKSMENSSRGSFGEVVSYLHVGGIFGYVDFSIGRRRIFSAICSEDRTTVAKFSKQAIEKLRRDKPDLHAMVEKVLLQACLMELANFDVA